MTRTIIISAITNLAFFGVAVGTYVFDAIPTMFGLPILIGLTLISVAVIVPGFSRVARIEAEHINQSGSGLDASR